GYRLEQSTDSGCHAPHRRPDTHHWLSAGAAQLLGARHPMVWFNSVQFLQPDREHGLVDEQLFYWNAQFAPGLEWFPTRHQLLGRGLHFNRQYPGQWLLSSTGSRTDLPKKSMAGSSSGPVFVLAGFLVWFWRRFKFGDARIRRFDRTGHSGSR